MIHINMHFDIWSHVYMRLLLNFTTQEMEYMSYSRCSYDVALSAHHYLTNPFPSTEEILVLMLATIRTQSNFPPQLSAGARGAVLMGTILAYIQSM